MFPSVFVSALVLTLTVSQQVVEAGSSSGSLFQACHNKRHLQNDTIHVTVTNNWECAAVCEQVEDCYVVNVINERGKITCELTRGYFSIICDELTPQITSTTISRGLVCGKKRHFDKATESCVCNAGLLGPNCEVCPFAMGYVYDAGTNKCYRIDATVKSFLDARATCAAEGGHLLRIENKGVWDMITPFFYQPEYSAVRVFYFDGTDVGHSRIWKNSDGEVLTYVYWQPGEPNNVAEQCLGMYVVRAWRVIDAGCGGASYVCEIGM